MRVLILGLNYLPESTSIGPYTADLASYLNQQGHAVQVVTSFPLAPQWRIWDGYRNRLFQREEIDGVSVLRTYVYVPSRPGQALQRVIFDMSFAIAALVGGLTRKSPDVIIAVSPPLQLGLTALALRFFTRSKIFFHIQDLVPDAAIAVGSLSAQSWAVQIGRKLEAFVYQRVQAIGVICGGFRHNLLEKQVPSAKIVDFPNYIDLDFMQASAGAKPFREEHGIAEREYVVMYSGSVARKQGLATLVQAASHFDGASGVKFCLIGEGPYAHELRAEAASRGVTNLVFLPLQPREKLAVQLSSADVLVIPQRKAVTDMVFPGKLLYYMASGKPIIVAANERSETARFVIEHSVGLVVAAEDPVALAKAVRYLRSHADEAAQLGQNGRRAVAKYFDRKVVLKNISQKLLDLTMK